MPSSEATMRFPVRGIDRLESFQMQEAYSTFEGINVRAFDVVDRARGGSRAGLSRYIDEQIGSLAWLVSDLNQITIVGTPVVQSSSSGRIVYLVAVQQGKVYYAEAGATSWTEATDNATPTPPLNTSGVIRSAANGLKLYFADGTNEVYFDPSTLSVENWAESAGTLPVDGSGNRPRLIATWRGRTVLSGVLEDSQNWFMSAVNDATNWDYSPASTTPTQAIAGNNAPQGLIGDVINGLCPYNDDVLIFFGDHTIYMMRGDPLSGGSIDLVTSAIGGVWGTPWCMDPQGAIYFFSNLCGIYRMDPYSGQFDRISRAIDNILEDIDTGKNNIRLAWNDRYQGFHVFITPTANALAGEDAFHLFWEARTDSWWKDTFANYRHNPLAVHTFDGNLPGDRTVIIGSWDGIVRSIDDTATTDDGHDIESSVWIGPILSREMDDMLLQEVQAMLGETSGDVTYSIHTGNTPEEALASEAVFSDTWSAGRNPNMDAHCAGHAVYIKITSTNRWAMESIRLKVQGKGKIRRRQYRSK